MSSSPVESAHLAARKVAKATGKPWLADFRDPWYRGLYRHYPTPFHRRLQQNLERKVVEDASLVIANTEAALEDFRQRYPHLPPRKFSAIPNGFDPQEFEQAAGQHPADLRKPLKIIHLGGMTLDRDPEVIFKALAELKREEEKGARPAPHLELVGMVENKFRRRAEILGVSDLVEFCGPLKRPRALEKLVSADLGLVLESFREGAELVVPAKTYDYLGARIPVLAVVPEGACALLIRKTNTGEVITKPESRQVAAVLRKAAEKHAAGQDLLGIMPDFREIEKYRRQHLLDRLENLLTGMLK